MTRIRWTAGLLAACTLLSGVTAFAQTTMTASKMLETQPRQKGIDCTYPSAAEVAACEVRPLGGAAGNSGYLLVDVSKKPLRRLFAYSSGGQRITVLSYYKDGLEVYREITNGNGKAPNEYRWFNSGGMKWGADANEDGIIDSWKMISEYEVAEEAFQAVVTKDFARLRALFVSESELQSLGLPAAYVGKINEKIQGANKKFDETVAKVKVDDPAKATGRVESSAMHCVPGESIGTSHDLFRYPSLAILYEAKEKKHEWLQTGEMVKVGMAWRLIDVPSVGSVEKPGDLDNTNPKVAKLMAEIASIDGKINVIPVNGTANVAVGGLYLERVATIDQLLSLVPAKDLEGWYKQKADNLQAAALNSKEGDTRALAALRTFRDQIVAQNAQGSLAGYVTYRALWSEYAPLLSNNKSDLAKVQAAWLEKLADFVKSYQKADDTPDALIQLAMGAEFGGKDDLAKGYYEQLAKNFPQHTAAAKAEGAIRRLNLVGSPLSLASTTLTNQQFNITALRNKVVAVYYWASYCTNCPADFAKLKKLQDEYRAQGFEVVTVNLDLKATDALAYLQANPAPGTHLFTPAAEGSMDSPLAVQYGIMGLPSIFLVGRDGNVISRTIQINDLEDAIKKAQSQK